jgi:enamine deaminase RidA (YjgF/YER057c/UK114 family)
VHVAGQIGEGPDGVPAGLVEQFDLACANVVAALRGAGGEPGHVVSMQIFTTDVDGYREASAAIGEAYRRHFGRHYPAMALLGVDALLHPGAWVELVCTAVIPEDVGDSSTGGERA